MALDFDGIRIWNQPGQKIENNLGDKRDWAREAQEPD
jgi:hypothetical protein